MTLATGEVSAETLSEGWLRTLDLVNETPGRKLFQTVTRISSPTLEDPDVRAMAERLAADQGYNPVTTVANTIFPVGLAAASADHRELANRYIAMYPRIRRLDRNNANGTYFGRLVAHPNGPNSAVNQLESTIDKLRTENSHTGPKSTRYEVSLEVVGEPIPEVSGQLEADDEVDESGEDLGSLPVMETYAVGRDNRIMAFPCLSFCSFQLDQGSLHLIAQYRAQSLVERGYGNYLGLAQLQTYVAAQADLTPGGLMVVAGRADATGASKFAIRKARGAVAT